MRLFDKSMHNNSLVFIKTVEDTDFLLSADTKLKKIVGKLLRIRHAQLITKVFQKLDISERFLGVGCLKGE